MAAPLFQDLLFFFIGRKLHESKTRADLSRIVQENGASVSKVFGSRVTHVVAGPDVAKLTTWTTIRSSKAFIVDAQWVLDSVAQDALQPIGYHADEVNPPVGKATENKSTTKRQTGNKRARSKRSANHDYELSSDSEAAPEEPQRQVKPRRTRRARKPVLTYDEEEEEEEEEVTEGIFAGLHICISGVSSGALKPLSLLVAAHGAVFEPSLSRYVSLLITDYPDSPKHRQASSLGIPTLRPAWVRDSVHKGAVQPYTEYMIDDRQRDAEASRTETHDEVAALTERFRETHPETPVLQGMKGRVSVIGLRGSALQDEVIRVVGEAGARVHDKIVPTTSLAVLLPDANGAQALEAFSPDRMPGAPVDFFPVVAPAWVLDSIAQGAAQPHAPYHPHRYGADDAESSAPISLGTVTRTLSAGALHALSATETVLKLPRDALGEVLWRAATIGTGRGRVISGAAWSALARTCLAFHSILTCRAFWFDALRGTFATDAEMQQWMHRDRARHPCAGEDDSDDKAAGLRLREMYARRVDTPEFLFDAARHPVYSAAEGIPQHAFGLVIRADQEYRADSEDHPVVPLFRSARLAQVRVLIIMGAHPGPIVDKLASLASLPQNWLKMRSVRAICLPNSSGSGWYWNQLSQLIRGLPLVRHLWSVVSMLLPHPGLRSYVTMGEYFNCPAGPLEHLVFRQTRVWAHVHTSVASEHSINELRTLAFLNLHEDRYPELASRDLHLPGRRNLYTGSLFDTVECFELSTAPHVDPFADGLFERLCTWLRVFAPGGSPGGSLALVRLCGRVPSDEVRRRCEELLAPITLEFAEEHPMEHLMAGH